MLEQLFDLEKDGMTLDLLQSQPPKVVYMSQAECGEGMAPTAVSCLRRKRGFQFPDKGDEHSEPPPPGGAGEGAGAGGRREAHGGARLVSMQSKA